MPIAPAFNFSTQPPGTGGLDPKPLDRSTENIDFGTRNAEKLLPLPATATLQAQGQGTGGFLTAAQGGSPMPTPGTGGLDPNPAGGVGQAGPPLTGGLDPNPANKPPPPPLPVNGGFNPGGGVGAAGPGLGGGITPIDPAPAGGFGAAGPGLGGGISPAGAAGGVAAADPGLGGGITPQAQADGNFDSLSQSFLQEFAGEGRDRARCQPTVSFNSSRLRLRPRPVQPSCGETRSWSYPGSRRGGSLRR